jgi:peptidoglycan/LPS O-acetylase OafA/YrhL
MKYYNQYGSTSFITGIKGYSVLAVFLIHSGGGGLREISYFTNEVVEKGKYGVLSFFIISAFTIAMSLNRSIKNGKFSYKNYIINRWLRIFPLFFLVALFAFLNGGNSDYLHLFNVNNDINNFILQISLLNVFFIKHVNNLIGVEWMLPIQFFYYFLFPIFFYILSSVRKNKILFFLFVVIAFSLSYYSIQIVSPFYSNLFVSIFSEVKFGNLFISECCNPIYRGLSNHWGVLKYLFTFISGFVTFFIFRNKAFEKIVKNTNKKIKNLVFLTILLGGFIFVILSKIHIDFVVIVFINCLMLSSFYRGRIVRYVFENPIIMYIGKISYSFYLTHYIVLGFIKNYSPILNFFFSLLVTISISTVTYYLIEKKFIYIGFKAYKGKINV